MHTRPIWVRWIAPTVAITVLLLISIRGFQTQAHAVIQDETPKANQESGRPDKTDPDHALSKFMRQKLHASNQILEGLCTEDLQLVADGSKVLMKMSTEERWRVSNDMMYRRYSKEFAESVDELLKEAEDGNMDGTSMAWVNVTMKCLKCHEWVRNTVVADGSP